MTSEVQKLFPAVKAFIEHDGKILLLQESSNYADGTNAGKWDVPGGRVNAGEKWQDGLLREIYEETGLSVKIGQPIAIGEWRPVVRGEQWQIIATFISCSLTGSPEGIILSQDHAAYQWFSIQEILNLENCASFIKEATQQYAEQKRA